MNIAKHKLDHFLAWLREAKGIAIDPALAAEYILAEGDGPSKLAIERDACREIHDFQVSGTPIASENARLYVEDDIGAPVEEMEDYHGWLRRGWERIELREIIGPRIRCAIYEKPWSDLDDADRNDVWWKGSPPPVI